MARVRAAKRKDQGDGRQGHNRRKDGVACAGCLGFQVLGPDLDGNQPPVEAPKFPVLPLVEPGALNLSGYAPGPCRLALPGG